MRIARSTGRSCALALGLVVGCGATGDPGAPPGTSSERSALSTPEAASKVRRALREESFAGLDARPLAKGRASTPSAHAKHLPAPIAPMTEHSGRFQMRGRNSAAFFTPQGFALSVSSGKWDQRRSWGLHASLVGAREITPVAEARARAAVHEFIGGKDPTAWKTDVPTYGRLAWEEIYPGIDMAVEPSRGGFSYRYIVSPGADPSRIVMAWEGAKALRVTDDGRGVDVETDIGKLHVSGLHAYVIDGDARIELPARHVIDGERVSVQVDGWDGTKPLVIDPSIAWASYLGGSGGETGDTGGAVDGSGNFYVVGTVYSTDFPTTTGAYDTSANGGVDVGITKITTAGVVAWSTYFGGSGTDIDGGIAVDSAGNVYVAGFTNGGLPILNAFQASPGGTFDAFVAKFTTAGALSWSSYLGGSDDDRATAITQDNAGSLYVAGYTHSTNFPTTGAYDTSHNGDADIFVAKVSATGGTSALLWSTYAGGAGVQYANGIVADATGVVVFGQSESSTFPLVNAFDSTFGGTGEGVVFKMAASGGPSSLLWSSFVGGSGNDSLSSGALDGTNVYIGGTTYGSDFPTSNAFDSTYGGGNEAFVMRINGAVTPPTVTWSSFLGGSGVDYISGMKFFGGNLYVGGYTNSPDFPLVNAFDSSLTNSEMFLARIKPAGGTGAIEWSTFLGGGAGEDISGELDIDSVGNLYVGGYTSSTDAFTKGAFDTTLGGTQDLFVLKIFRLAQGDACSVVAACPSGFCVDGVCCDTACTATCQACSATKKGSGADGTCGTIAIDTDPDNECAASGGYPGDCKADGLCNGAGACRVNAKSGVICSTTCSGSSLTTGTCNGSGTCSTSTASCALYACIGTACKTSCASDTDCAATAYCGVSTCAAKKADGVACGATNECTAGTCTNCGTGATCRTTACPVTDTGPLDTGNDTATADTAVTDTATSDTATADTATADTATADSATADAATADSATADARPADTASDGESPDTAIADTDTEEDTATVEDTPTALDTGSAVDASGDASTPTGATLPAEACGCQTPGRNSLATSTWLGLGLGLLAVRRRRSR